MRKNTHPMPVQRETRRRAQEAFREEEQEFYRDRDPRREWVPSGGSVGGHRINPAISEDE